jgi:hypothetical protein
MNAARTVLALGVAVVVGGVAFAQETTRVSVDSSGAEGNNESGIGWPEDVAISADGLIVAFRSDAANLVAGDTNACSDVFVHDRASGFTERVSVDSSGAQANDFSGGAAISADGMIVAIHSYASNLVAGDTNGADDIFVHDRSTGITERVSVDSSGAEGNSSSAHASISADGQVVAGDSDASNLVANDTEPDVFVHDRSTGITERVSVDSSGAPGDDTSKYASISADGQLVAFSSFATNLVPGDANGWPDVFVHDRASGITERVSVDSSGSEGNGYCDLPAISADGRCVVFDSGATNLVASDTNGHWDAFVHDRSTGITERVSVDSLGAEGNGHSYTNTSSMSADGGFVAFHSDASNLIANDYNATTDVFVHERCVIDATWSNYGTGFPGTNGVPTLTAESNPVFGSTVTLDLENSYGKFSAALLFVGFQQADIHSGWGGDLLVVPAVTLVVGLPPSGTSFTGDIPNDETLCGFVIDLQAIESDPGAAKGVSFTPGLQLVLGR